MAMPYIDRQNNAEHLDVLRFKLVDVILREMEKEGDVTAFASQPVIFSTIFPVARRMGGDIATTLFMRAPGIGNIAGNSDLQSAKLNIQRQSLPEALTPLSHHRIAKQQRITRARHKPWYKPRAITWRLTQVNPADYQYFWHSGIHLVGKGMPFSLKRTVDKYGIVNEKCEINLLPRSFAQNNTRPLDIDGGRLLIIASKMLVSAGGTCMVRSRLAIDNSSSST